MTPAARIASAIEILDGYLSGQPAEKLLTTWARQNRYAGSKDRAAVRDLVFEALRNLRSFAALGGAMTGRGLAIGALRAQEQNPDAFFTGEGYAPTPLTEEERAKTRTPEGAEALDCPDWLEAQFRESLGADFEAVMTLLKSRAPVFLRVNLRLATLQEAQDALATEDIETKPHPLSSTALEVTRNPRRVQNSEAYKNGLVELQDAASQFVADQVPISEGSRVLDYCAGGGGKSLAMAARVDAHFTAHDVSMARMKDIPARADRSRVEIEVIETSDLKHDQPYDVVLCDAPCSGSGSWRRAPEGKWALTQGKLDELNAIQSSILNDSKEYVGESGVLAYATCSMLSCENRGVVEAFLAQNEAWSLKEEHVLTPLQGGDGFYLAILTH
ncbi:MULTISPECIES: RsmB/NOP family class I SAM-dependent RNA methyltransferase [Halocynthiibacter]|uniref:RsmB/NOP family class I SAM-dependent RNA methyltransferase n=1 Tax=Halocynthiibacter halioticoli TaxID=2986804 RepID=A0AAE3IZA8_9RHOB|nr:MULTISPECIES: RsmB/NOP family class I SAM-dependent RNA methyltransferase [Halocynthiibacter]MCV6824464.1 RsmB/NOP family class I SAM-dependent RNA methyltransferase [Halocynthiibacter halioticoli]MCW4057465.1 RsmB/NOP family class I SAM-dependent RNA methyltransferase [Halocynthiibacter sp. SDUM655004]